MKLRRREREALTALRAVWPRRVFKREVADRMAACTFAASPRAWADVGLKALRDRGLAESTSDGVRATEAGMEFTS